MALDRSHFYDPDIFVDRDSLQDPDVICVICTLVCDDAVETSCGHLFCDRCLTATLEAMPGVCPSCRGKLDTAGNGARPAVLMRRLIDGKRVKCIYTPAAVVAPTPVAAAAAVDGTPALVATPAPPPPAPIECNWMGRRGDLKVHIDTTCVSARIPCAACQEIVRRGDLTQHGAICPRRVVTCEHCETKMAIDELPTHTGVCDAAPVTCVNDCKTEGLRRRDLVTHVTSCPLLPHPCQYQPYGCEFKGTQPLLVTHMNDASIIATHLSYTMNHITTVTAANQELRQRMSAMEATMELLAHELRHQRDVTASVSETNRLIIQELKQAPSTTKSSILSRVFGGSNSSTKSTPPAPSVDRSPRAVPASVPIGTPILLPHQHPLTYSAGPLIGRACDGCNKSVSSAFQCGPCSYDLCHHCADACRDAAADAVADARERKSANLDALRRFTVSLTSRHRHALQFGVRLRDRRCDICRLAPCIESYQCTTCDFDCCLTCFDSMTGRTALLRANATSLLLPPAPVPAHVPLPVTLPSAAAAATPPPA